MQFEVPQIFKLVTRIQRALFTAGLFLQMMATFEDRTGSQSYAADPMDAPFDLWAPTAFLGIQIAVAANPTAATDHLFHSTSLPFCQNLDVRLRLDLLFPKLLHFCIEVRLDVYKRQD